MLFRNLFKNHQYLNEIEDIEHEFKSETAGDKTEITIYGAIGSYWFMDSTSASDIKNVLKDNESKEIVIHLNSGGGDAFDGIAIYNQLKNHDAKIIVHIDGFAASAASIIAMAADELIMHTGTMMMIHEASTVAWGTKKEVRSALNALEGLDKSLVDIYMTRFKGERSEMETFIENETWFTVDEAVAVGLADKVADPDEDRADPEAFKNSVLARFQKQPVASANKNLLERFKRPV
ncbi:Clp protease ClpP [Halalkalibacterium halodurans]|uniref:head maturation protease, ClpP-related n=1 Tax=Halalkalibacterium halodurans TaxID=86665 RepID=UPI002E224BBD|nr:head maturation protease, ClpP-related [Halalkalibacterium halodurans]MED4172366.1 Clp protease ClpP [Halalkalibacterium halodurans]